MVRTLETGEVAENRRFSTFAGSENAGTADSLVSPRLRGDDDEDFDEGFGADDVEDEDDEDDFEDEVEEDLEDDDFDDDDFEDDDFDDDEDDDEDDDDEDFE